MTDATLLEDASPSNLTIEVANYELITAKLVGTVRLYMQDTGQTLTLRNAHYVPALASNLISISTLLNDNISTHFVLGDKGMLLKGDDVVTVGIKRDGLFHVYASSSSVSPGTSPSSPPHAATATLANARTGTLDERHERLGRANKPAILELAKQLLPEQMTVTRRPNDLKSTCVACAAGKQTRSPQPAKDTSASAPTDEIGSVLVADITGKIKPADRYGNRYVLTVVDVASGVAWTFAIGRKSHAAAKVLEVIAQLKTQHQLGVKVLRTDRGGEFTSAELSSKLAAAGILPQLTERDTSASNGKAERMHRT